MNLPPKLQALVDFFEPLSEGERRDNLVAYALLSARYAPRPGERFDVVDLRKDAQCADAVGVYVRTNARRRVLIRVALGPEVQTLTRAMAVILCKGLDGCAVETVRALSPEFVAKIVGAQLVRLRSQAVYYMLSRIQAACR